MAAIFSNPFVSKILRHLGLSYFGFRDHAKIGRNQVPFRFSWAEVRFWTGTGTVPEPAGEDARATELVAATVFQKLMGDFGANLPEKTGDSQKKRGNNFF